MNSTPRSVLVLILLGFALALLRAVPLLSHAPLLAVANSFDQARYTGCFELFPDRDAAIRPDENSPNAPFEFYRYQVNPVRLCYGSSELIPQAAVNAVYKIEESQGIQRHSVRWLGALRLLLLTVLVAAFCRAWLRRGEWPAALANAAVFGLVLSDPGNTMYFNTFYAEGSALVAAYALINLVLLAWGRARSGGGMALLALGAFLLATSKIQHLALPLALSLVVLAWGRWHGGRWPWQGLALLAGAVLGCALQFAQLGRNDPMMNSIRSFNRANIVFTGMLPAASDALATTRRLGLPDACAAHSGKSAWQLPGLAEDVCPGMEKLGRVAFLREFARDPQALLRYARNGVEVLNPFVPRNLGHVEGQILGKLPAGFVSVNGLLDRNTWLRNLLFVLPLLSALLLLRRGNRASLLAALLATLMLATFGITLMGDGLADVAKQGHLIFNAALCWPLIALIAALGQRRHTATAALVRGGVDTVDLDQQLQPANVPQQHQPFRRVG